MSELPLTWTQVSLSEISSVPDQRIPDKAEHFRYIDIASIDRKRKVIRETEELTGVKAPSRARKVVRTGDVLVSMTRPNLNAVALVPAELDGHIASTGFDVLRPTGVDPRWLYYLVRSRAFVDQMSGLVQGALYPAVRSKDVRAFMAPLAPLAEQKRIADKLDWLLAAVDTCKARLDAIPAIIKRFRQSVIAAATSGKLTEEWRGAQTSLAQPPRAAWRCTSVEALALPGGIFDGARDHGAGTKVAQNLRIADYTKSGVRVVRLENLGHLEFIDEKQTFISHEKYAGLKQSTVVRGDVLVGSFVNDSVRVCVLPALNTPAITKADCFCVRPKTEVVSPEFLALQFASNRTYQSFQQEVHGLTRPRIATKHLRELQVQICSMEEQLEIVRRVNELFSLSESIEERARALSEQAETLVESIISKAFSGKLLPTVRDSTPRAGEKRDVGETPSSRTVYRILGRARGADSAHATDPEVR